jgi:ligand-binding sensor domain-containing protein/HPt (histidine-containing phosphotransfer) domain-containing protein
MTHPCRAFCKFLLILISAGYMLAGKADIYQPSFQTVLHDTSPGEIKVIMQDRHGYMWFGGRNSVLRYDAYTFQTISFMETKDGKTRTSYYVTSMLEDANDNIWITSHTGLYLFDPDRELLTRPSSPDGTIDAIVQNPLQDIAQLPAGELMFGGDGSGLTIIDPKDFRILWHSGEAGASDFSPSVQRIYVDTQNRIWVANNQGLNLFDPIDKKFTLFIPNPSNPNSKADNAMVSLAEDRFGNILGGTLGKGLYIFDPTNNTFANFMNDPQNPESIPDNSIWKILIDHTGKIWMSHSRTVFSWFDQDKRTFRVFNYALGQAGSPTYNAGRAIYEDNNHDIWIGHYPGTVSFHDRSTAAISVYRKNIEDPNGISDSNILAVKEDAEHNLWIAAGDGVNHFNRGKGQFNRYTYKLGNYPAKGTLSAYIDRLQNVWIGTWTEGLFRLNRTSNKFDAEPSNATLATSSEKHSSALNDATVWGFCETNDQSFWLGTHYAGISRYDIQAKQFTKYKSENTETTLPNNVVWTCLEDSKGRFWIGTAHGLSLMDRKSETFKSYIPDENNPNGLRSSSVLDIYEDHHNRIWLATNTGLHLFRESTEDFQIFNVNDGFHNDGIRAITADQAGNLWLGTNNGITRFNPETRQVKNYLHHAGKTFGGVNTGAALTSHSGEIIFGTVDGLVIIDVNRLVTNTQPPPIVLTDFKIFTRSVSPRDSDTPLERVINRTDVITLDHTKRMFSFDFAALNYRNPERNQYAYKLEGFDRDWHQVGNTREAQYTNLNAGRYVFKVRAANNDGLWSDAVKSIEIHQLPPPWRTWWAYLIYASIVMLVIGNYLIAQRRKQQFIEKQNQLLELKVTERTKDLADKNRDIHSLLSNMRQGLFTIQEDGTIHHEYSAFLETIFDTEQIAYRDAVDFLFDHAVMDGDAINQIRACLMSSIGMDISSFQFNSHLLPAEYLLNMALGTKTLSLDWNPIVENDVTIKLMVSVRDITELKLLENEAKHKERELDMVAQLLNLPAEKYHRYYESASALINSSRRVLAEAESLDADILAQLFRDMHTLKGNSRAQGLNHAANCAHEAENLYASIQATPGRSDIEKILATLNHTETCLDEYHYVYVNVLGRKQSDRNDYFNAAQNQWLIADIQKHLSVIRDSNPEVFQRISSSIEISQAAPLGKTLEELAGTVLSTAAELNKPSPTVSIQADDLWVKKNFIGPLTAIFVHLINNALDHGIESAEERLACNKPPAGRIDIQAVSNSHQLTISLSDDGRGLDLTTLYQKALAQNLADNAQAFSRQQVADTIFRPGVSTRTFVSALSGRGVGLDAVKHMVQDSNGQIALEIANPDGTFENEPNGQAEPFRLTINLPLNLFFSRGGGEGW